MKRLMKNCLKVSTMLFAMMALYCVLGIASAHANETEDYDAELVGVTSYYNMGLNVNMTGGSAGTIYPGEKFKILRTEESSKGIKYYVYAINADKKGYVSEKYVKLVDNDVAVTETDKKISYIQSNDIYHKLKTVVTYSDGKTSEDSVNEKHTFANGKCDKCGDVQSPSDVGSYVVLGSTKVYKKTNSASGMVKTLKSGTKVVVSKVTTNQYNNYWGQLSDGSGYVWMGNLKKDELSNVEYDAELTGVTSYYNMGLNAAMSGGSAGTIYPGEKFKILGEEETTSGIKYYVYAINADKKGYVSEKYVKMVENDHEYFYRAQNESQHSVMEIFRDSSTGLVSDSNLIGLEDHVWSGNNCIKCDETKEEKVSYVTSNDMNHRKITVTLFSTGEKKTLIKAEKHVFDDGKCTLCGKKWVDSVAGEYTTLNRTQVYYGSVSSSTKIKKLNKGETITISEVCTNIFNNYWGKLSDGSGYVWMGNLECVEDIYLKQVRGSRQCTLTSATMILRKYAKINGKDYNDITVDSVGKVAWVTGKNGGLLSSFEYNGIRVVSYSMNSLSYEEKKDKLIDLLREHPEGIALNDMYLPHCIMLVNYDASNDIFYVADPSNNVAVGIIPLTASDTRGITQEEKISKFTGYWCIVD